MRDEQGGPGVVGEVALQLGCGVQPGTGVQRGQGLVQQQQVRLHGESPCQGDSLGLAAGESWRGLRLAYSANPTRCSQAPP
jgi:hypothetical protein